MTDTTTLQWIIDQDDSDLDIEIEVDVDWDGQPETAPRRSGSPDNWDDGDPGYFDINKMTLCDDVPEAKLKAGTVIEVSQVRETEDAIQTEIISNLQDDFDEPDYDDEPYGCPSHDYIYEGP